MDNVEPNEGFENARARTLGLLKSLEGRLPDWLLDDVRIYLKEGDEVLAFECLAEMCNEYDVPISKAEYEEFLAAARYWSDTPEYYEFLLRLISR